VFGVCTSNGIGVSIPIEECSLFSGGPLVDVPLVLGFVQITSLLKTTTCPTGVCTWRLDDRASRRGRPDPNRDVVFTAWTRVLHLHDTPIEALRSEASDASLSGERCNWPSTLTESAGRV